MTKLEGKVALVTGSSSGIGRAIAELFAREGARVAVHGRNRERIDRVVHTVAERGGIAAGFAADITSCDQMERLRAAIEEELGPVDLVVANAGGSPLPPGPVEEITEEGWRASVDVNLTSTFFTVKCFLPGMKERRHGNFITFSSSAGRAPHPMSPVAYAAAKAGIEMLTKDLAAQAGPFGIRVNCIAPGTILTERNRELIPDAQKVSLAGQHPLRRLGTPEDVAETALYLASDSSSWLTGVIVDVAGGSVML